MTPERWAAIERLYHAALQQAVEQRAVFLRDSCAGDDDLREEVESLLHYGVQGGDGIEAPAAAELGAQLSSIASAVRRLHDPLVPGRFAGRSVGPYDVTTLIAAGGMGEVYRAIDGRLDRTVAIKILPDHLAADPERRERFGREAKIVSTLSHPHICALYDVGVEDGVPYLVMEHVEGETLEARIERGPVPWPQSLELLRQMADAVDQAHRRGIVHRDLKPANVMLTHAGVKLLDFGLATWAAPTGGAVTGPAFDGTPRLTGEGRIMGTAHYLSPEQLHGKQPDARTDIFAFGVVAYEMLTGRRAFDGDSPAALMGAILKDDPRQLTELVPGVPDALTRTIVRCLAKNPDARWQTASDLSFQLRSMIPGPDRPVLTEAQQRSRWRRRAAWTAAAAIVCAIVAMVAVFAVTQKSPHRERRYLDPGRVTVTRVTETGKVTNATISADGRYVAYVEAEGDEYGLWVQDVTTGGRTQVIPRQDGILRGLTFSPNGRHLYFTRGHLGSGFMLHRMLAIGGSETPILDDVDTPVSFSPDGKQFVFMRGAGAERHIVIADALGGWQRILATRRAPLTFTFFGPSWSPDGRIVAVSAADLSEAGRWSIVLLSVADGSSREIYSGGTPIGRVRWLPDGSGLLAVVSKTLVVQGMGRGDGGTGGAWGGAIWHVAYPGGRAERLTRDLTDHDLCCLDAAADGKTVVTVQSSLVSDLWIAAVDRLDQPHQLTWGTPVIRRHSWLPDNDTIVYRDLSGSLNAAQRDGRTRTLPIPENHSVGELSACGDGRFVVFHLTPENTIWRISPATGGATRLTSGYFDSNPSCSPDGQSVMYTSIRGGRPAIWQVPIDGGEPIQLIQSDSWDALPSPSGRFIHYAAFEWDDHPVRLRRMRWIVISARDRRRMLSSAALIPAPLAAVVAWAPDESGLDYVVTQAGVSNIWRQPLAGGPPAQITHFSAGRLFGFAWSPNGKWLSLASGLQRSDAVLMNADQ